MTVETAKDFEQTIAQRLRQDGWSVSAPPFVKGYELEAVKGQEVVAIHLRSAKTPIKVPQIESFLATLEQPTAGRFTGGMVVTQGSYSRAALTYFEQAHSKPVRLGLWRDGAIQWINQETLIPTPSRREPLYLGVFTCKGGVGKTTVSAHLAGAFALSGYDVALLDLDPQKNLTTLLGQGVKLGGAEAREDSGHQVRIYDWADWDMSVSPSEKIVVCDCSPVLSANPRSLIEKFTYCIIPTTLNPLGLNKNGHVIRRTLEEIRAVNPRAFLFVLINNHLEDETLRGQVLREQYHLYFSDLARQDDRFKFVDPDEVAIRHSKQLFYWGYHIYSGDKNQLAFNPVGGRCLPKADFLNLLNYLEEHSELETLKGSTQ